MAGAIITRNPGVASRRPLILALVLGAIAAGLVVAVLANSGSNKTSSTASSASVPVVVARDYIAVGTQITADMVEVKQIPQTAAISDPISAISSVVGQVTRFPVNANEQISQGRLIQAAQAKSLSFVIPAGLRAVAVPVDKTSSPSELIAPGDFVDVLVTANAVDLTAAGQAAAAANNANSNFKASVTLLQNVQVLSIQKNFVDNGVPYDVTVRGTPDSKTDGNYVTLALTPDQAQLLTLASQDGKVTLALRAFGDDKVAPVAPVTEPVAIK